MNNEMIKIAATVTAATVSAVSPKAAPASIVSKDAVQDTGKARFGSGMMRF